ncbi:MAG: hypothetical protein WCI74_17270, partial [Actinomycetes bacterium]
AQSMNPVTADALGRVTFVADANHAWAVGSNRKIYATSDGGLTPWTTVQVAGVPTDFLADVGFAALNNGWAVGESGTIAHYNGFGWTVSTVGGHDLDAIAVVDANHVWVVGNGGTILFWNGSSWAAQDSGSTRPLRGVAFTDINNGWAVGGYGAVLRTTDGGLNWSSVTSGTMAWLNSVAMTDATHGTIVGMGGAIYTIADGALYLTAIPSPTTSVLYDVDFTDANHGWLVGAPTGGNATVLAYTVPTPTSTTISGPTSVSKGKNLKLSGHVSQSAAPGTVTIAKSRLVGKKWRSAGTATVALSGGAYKYSFKPRYKGKWCFVATYSGGAVGYANYAGSTSATKNVKVK